MECRKMLTIRLSEEDNVIVACGDIDENVEIPEEQITTKGKIPAGYKIASRRIREGEKILKFNTVIGYAAEDTEPGTMMHSHNIRFDQVEKDYAFSRDYRPAELIPEGERAIFQGIVRSDGRVAVRNYIAVLIAGNCAATAAKKVADFFNEERMKEYPNVDGVIPLITGIGCGMEMTGEPMDMLRRTMAGYIRNPNIYGTVVMALGCERNNIDVFFDACGLKENDRLYRIVMQEIGGTKAAVEAGIRAVQTMLPKADDISRQPVSAEHIVLGLQCGGSDGFSGLSANPALGKAVDLLVKNGGTAILAEISELFGVEHTLTCRAKTPEVGLKIVERINWWLEYNKGKDTQINGKVSPGNHKGGLANVLEKSLGGVKKGGSTPLNQVLEYAEPVTEKGLVLMDSPGFDPVSVTGEIASGATLIAFTTGRGSCFGSVPSPTVKLASNTPMYRRMQDDMDINCGSIIDGEKTIEEMGQEIFEEILAVASGKKSKSEELGVGVNEYDPWQVGVLA